jgi:hypothetical protein
MSSSSRSIAAARSRRAGESQPPVSGGRPGTSIGSHAAFAPPQPPSNNVRVAKAPIQQQQQMPQNGLPFSKLSISDAIGLVTLRLGRVEQFVIDFENGNIVNSNSKGTSIPENSKIVDNSVLTTIINRLDSLEKKEVSNASSVASSVASSFASLDQVSKLEKDLKETRELLSHLIYKLELFSKETNDKFGDFEGAISEIEKNMEVHQFVDTNEILNVVVTEQTPDIVTEGNISLTTVDLKNPTVDLKNPTVDLKNPTVDLKNLIKQEFSESNL